MNGNQAGLAELINKRAHELRLSKGRLAHLAGISGGVLRPVNLLNRALSDKSKAGVERALRWEAGSIDVYLRTGERPRAVAGYSGADERLKRQQEIRAQIQLIDERVEDLRRRRQELMEELMVFLAEGYER